MGYSITLNSIYNIQEYLDILLSAKETTTVFNSKNPSKLAYSLRQAQVVAKKLECEPYNELDYTFKQAESTVICIRNTPVYATLVKAVVNEGVPHPEVKNMEEVVSICIVQKCNLLFSNFVPSEQQLSLLNEWGKESKFEFYISNNKLIARYGNA